MKNVLFTFSIVLLAVLGYHDYSGFTSPHHNQLETVWGGQDAAAKDCQDCMVTMGSCLGNSCNPIRVRGFRLWIKKTGSLTNKMKCFVVKKTAPGAKDCHTDTPKVCYTTAFCADAACTNCGNAVQHKVDTNCSVGGEYCPPKKAPGAVKLMSI